jgi:hypothetical protein
MVFVNMKGKHLHTLIRTKALVKEVLIALRKTKQVQSGLLFTERVLTGLMGSLLLNIHLTRD